MTQLRLVSSLSVLLAFSFACSHGVHSSKKSAIGDAAPQTTEARSRSEALGPQFGISTQGVATTRIAKEILLKGGNVIDAMVAASLAITVERPHSTSISGGGFLMYREAKTGKVYAVDFRERAPLKASRDMYLDSKGEVIPRLSLDGMLAVATPGLVKGLAEIHKKFGHLPWKSVVQPAIDLAEKGFPVYPALNTAMVKRSEWIKKNPATAKIFLKADGTPYAVGETLIQKDLGKSLRLIAKQGPQAMYHGPLTQKILAESSRLHGILSQKDFDGYRVHWREPATSTFHGYQVFSMPPPSSGGAIVVQMLNILENDPLKELGFESTASIHRIASASQLAFADRAEYLGDPDFVQVPLKQLASKDYARAQRARIDENRKIPSDEIKPGLVGKYESKSTTHFSIIDEQGNMVASTQTLNGLFGSGVVPAGTGIVLNNEMDDFSAKPGAANLFGAIGGTANAIAPLKTPLSSMSPTLVLKDGQPVLAVGAPGGTRILTCVTQTVLNYLVYGLPLYDAIAKPRFHHQWRPDVLDFDAPGPGEETVKELEKLGYKVNVTAGNVYCNTMAVAREGSKFHAVSDPRDAGTSAVGE